jgi:transcriptional regulator of acetoin/glycerol metabolism
LRVIASSTTDLRALVEAGDFRPDLYSRLAHYEAHIPAVRERREDMGLLLRALTRVRGNRALKIETAAFRRILGFSWPFNIRELRQTVAAVNALTDDGVITLPLLEEVLARDASLPDDPAELQKVRDALLGHLKDTRGNVTAVARQLGRPIEEVERILGQFHIDPKAFTGQAAARPSSGTLVDMVTSEVFDDDGD